MSSKNVVAKVAQPYAEALIDIVKASNTIEVANKDITFILDVLLSNKSLVLFLDNPVISNQDKKNLISKVFAEYISPIVLDFLMVLVDRGRIRLLQNVADKYLELAYKLSSIIVAKVTTVQSFSPDQEAALITKIKVMTKSNEVKLLVEIDKELLGGFTVQVGSKMIDASLKGKIRQVASHLDVII